MKIDRIAAEWAPRLLSLLRIVLGLLFLEFGTAKEFHFPHVTRFEAIDQFSLEGLSGIFEFAGGALITLGLYTRPVAFILSGEMAAAYFIAHAPRGFFPILNGGVDAIAFCFAYLYLAAAGGGPWSLDAYLRGGRRN